MLRLLIVDQDVAFRRRMSRAFKLLGTLRVQLASGSNEMLKVAVENCPEIAIIDMGIPIRDTLHAISHLRSNRSHVGVIVTSIDPRTEDVVRLLKAGAQDFLRKQMDLSSMIETIEDLIETHSPATHALARRLDQYLRNNSKCPSSLW